MLCRQLGTSRSQLYRLMEGAGGVTHYIKRQRLFEGYAALCDTSNTRPIAAIAEELCFADRSAFTRAFRHEFGTRPSDVRAASLGDWLRGRCRRRTPARSAISCAITSAFFSLLLLP